MKKIVIAAVLMMALGLAACGQNEAPAAQQQNGGGANMANPWRDITEAEVKDLCPQPFRSPVGAQNVHWSVMESAAAPSGVPGALVQLKFDLDGNSFTARQQKTGDEEIDASGMYYKWTAQAAGVLKNWNGEACMNYRFIGENEWADLCIWHDAAVGVSYSVSVVAEDLDGFDLQALAEALHP